MTLAQLEAALRRARHDVFSDDEAVVEAATIRIRELRTAIEAHPDEVRRRAEVKHRQDERRLRLWA